MADDPKTIVLTFIQHINAGDLEGIYALMTDDHTFIDSLGRITSGRETMRTAWVSYYQIIPDYSIEVQDIVQVDDFVAVFGSANGTYAVEGRAVPDNGWKIPAAWKAIVRDEKIAHWQIYADNKPV